MNLYSCFIWALILSTSLVNSTLNSASTSTEPSVQEKDKEVEDGFIESNLQEFMEQASKGNPLESFYYEFVDFLERNVEENRKLLDEIKSVHNDVLSLVNMDEIQTTQSTTSQINDLIIKLNNFNENSLKSSKAVNTAINWIGKRIESIINEHDKTELNKISRLFMLAITQINYSNAQIKEKIQEINKMIQMNHHRQVIPLIKSLDKAIYHKITITPISRSINKINRLITHSKERIHQQNNPQIHPQNQRDKSIPVTQPVKFKNSSKKSSETRKNEALIYNSSQNKNLVQNPVENGVQNEVQNEEQTAVKTPENKFSLTVKGYFEATAIHLLDKKLMSVINAYDNMDDDSHDFKAFYYIIQDFYRQVNMFLTGIENVIALIEGRLSERHVDSRSELNQILLEVKDLFKKIKEMETEVSKFNESFDRFPTGDFDLLSQVVSTVDILRSRLVFTELDNKIQGLINTMIETAK